MKLTHSKYKEDIMEIITDITNEKIRHNERMLGSKLTEAYLKMNTYEEKIVFLYSIIMKSQKLYFDYTNNELILPDTLKELIRKCRESNIENDSDFIDFINENLVIPSKSGHLYLSPIEVVSNQISSPMSNEKNLVIKL